MLPAQVCVALCSLGRPSSPPASPPPRAPCFPSSLVKGLPCRGRRIPGSWPPWKAHTPQNPEPRTAAWRRRPHTGEWARGGSEAGSEAGGLWYNVEGHLQACKAAGEEMAGVFLTHLES